MEEDDEKERDCYRNYEQQLLELALEIEDDIKYLLSKNHLDVNISMAMLKDLKRFIEIKFAEAKQKVNLKKSRYEYYESALNCRLAREWRNTNG